jgi:hypothetical protein
MWEKIMGRKNEFLVNVCNSFCPSCVAAAEQAGKSLIDIFPLDNEFNDEKCMSRALLRAKSFRNKLIS